MKVYIGYDEREHEAAVVARDSLLSITKGQLEPTFIKEGQLRAIGMLTRLSDHRGGQDYDLPSQAPAATRFAISRFLTPLLALEGFALFTDCDVVFREDPRNMLQEVAAGHAVNVVKHNHQPTEIWKMVNQSQTQYDRKNWSSVMLFNCDHIANRRLSLRDVNERPGRDLHGFYWLHDDEIGTLHQRWNWLVNVGADQTGGIAHFTLGGPWLPGWCKALNDDVWLDAELRARPRGDNGV